MNSPLLDRWRERLDDVIIYNGRPARRQDAIADMAAAGVPDELAERFLRETQVVAFAGGFVHNSVVASPEPGWGGVDKTKLPRMAFAEQGDPDKVSTWGFPHHWVKDGSDPDANGRFTDGTLYLHQGGLNAAWAMAMGGRSGQKAPPAVIAHLRAHRKALGLDD